MDSASQKTVVSVSRDDVLGISDAVEIARLIRDGDIHPREAVEAAIARAEQVNPLLNAIATPLFESARAEAERPRVGVFAGVPSFIKDNDAVAGSPFLFGSRALPTTPAPKSTPFVEQFLSLGFVNLGKTTMPEFGLTGTTEALLHGPTHNPWRLGFSPGGSSGGSAALVAAGVVPVAHANDGGGSIRIPASCCGLVGLKPSRGRFVDVEGSKLLPVKILHQGMLSRSVRDTAVFVHAAEQYQRNPKLPSVGLATRPGRRLRIGFFTDLDAAERGMTIYGAPRPELPTWPRLLRNKGAGAPGKQAYVSAMRTAYDGNVTSFNTTYGTDLATWDALLAATDWRSRTDYGNAREIADNTAFLRDCVDAYYRKAKEAFRRYDTNHLFFGDKINGNSDTIDNVLDITTKYTDIVFYQIYGRYAEQGAMMDRWTNRVNMPFLNGDSSFSFTCDVMPSPYGPHARDQAQRAEWLREFTDSAFARPDFVGWHICGTVDTWNTMDGKDAKQHSGIMTATGEFYPELEAAIQEFSATMYDIAVTGHAKE